MERVSDLSVHVKGDKIFVAQAGRDFFAIYQKAKYEPELEGKGRLYGPREFLSKAWLIVNEKARELGWVR
jgi:hypothetical protein